MSSQQALTYTPACFVCGTAIFRLQDPNGTSVKDFLKTTLNGSFDGRSDPKGWYVPFSPKRTQYLIQQFIQGKFTAAMLGKPQQQQHDLGDQQQYELGDQDYEDEESDDGKQQIRLVVDKEEQEQQERNRRRGRRSKPPPQQEAEVTDEDTDELYQLCGRTSRFSIRDH